MALVLNDHQARWWQAARAAGGFKDKLSLLLPSDMNVL